MEMSQGLVNLNLDVIATMVPHPAKYHTYLVLPSLSEGRGEEYYDFLTAKPTTTPFLPLEPYYEDCPWAQDPSAEQFQVAINNGENVSHHKALMTLFQ